MSVNIKIDSYESRISRDLKSTDLQIEVDSTLGLELLGAGQYCYLTLISADHRQEIVKVTALSNQLLTVERAQAGSTALDLGKGDQIFAYKAALIPNAGPVERAVEQQMQERFSLDGEVLRYLWNPQKCPVKILPWLAWALSVDVWEDSWDEEVKREVVKTSVDVHRRKGTLHAVKTAVKSVYDDAEVQEWFQYGGSPYHFLVQIIREDGQFDFVQTDRALALVKSAKNVRSKLDALRVTFRQRSKLTLGLAQLIHYKTTIYPKLYQQISKPFSLGKYPAMGPTYSPDSELYILGQYPLGGEL